MKKLLLFTYFFASLLFQGKAQEDWLCVYPNKKVYFEDSSQSVYCIRIDSAFNDNKVLYPFSDLHQISEDFGRCYSVTSGSWLSKYIELDENGNTIFVNGDNRPILIKNQAGLNDTWDVFENEKIKVKGKIISVSEEPILGVADSVKTISFSVYNSEDIPINHILNQITIKVSKHFGLVKTVNFYSFEHTINDYWNDLDEFNLIGISEPQLGFQNINLKEQYFDFQVGDELHIWGVNFTSMYQYSERKIIHKYLSRINYEDSISYHYERKIHHSEIKIMINGLFDIDVSTSIDTVEQKIVKGRFFETEPNEPYGNWDEIYKVMIVNTPLPKMYFLNTYLYWDSYSSCFREVIWDGCNTLGVYYPGLGGPYYGRGDYNPFCSCYDLVYYKKGDIEVGTPFDFKTSIPEYKKELSFSVYPNPAGNYITIKSEYNDVLNNGMLEIYDIQGKNRLTKQLDDSNRVDISFLSAGYYMIKLTQINKDIVYFKFIKQ